MAILFGLVIVVGIIAIMSVIHGWVLTCLWEWFVIPIFHLDPLSIKMAIGLSLVVGLFRGNVSTSDKDDNTSPTVKMGIHLAAPFLTLLIGWLVHSC
jgi:uncharacterized membrane protein